MSDKTENKAKSIKIKNVVSFNTLKLMHLHNFNGDMVSFWQAIYLDSGSLKVYKDNETYILKEGCIYFIEPGHEYYANSMSKNCEITIFAYEPLCNLYDVFTNKIFRLSLDTKDILSALEREYKKTYNFIWEGAYNKVVLNPNAPFAAEQLLCNLLEQFLIQIIRDFLVGNMPLISQGSVKQSKEKTLVKEITDYLNVNVYKKISIADISNDLFLSKTYMQSLFKKQMGISVMDYYNRLKIDAAKIMIEENKLNFTEISELLGFSSIYHFSRRFKETSGLTPSEYSKSIRR